MSFNEYLIRYWSMTENEFSTFSSEAQRKIRHEYAVFLKKQKQTPGA